MHTATLPLPLPPRLQSLLDTTARAWGLRQPLRGLHFAISY
ncbi:hypothetical protein ACFO3A_14905 [Comamonas nitrativorans]|uniref:Uncharacterized protein n=1 Tax=Comamonas nitrativorans TaxID=108437 RepID=A0ABV9H392_9BURK